MHSTTACSRIRSQGGMTSSRPPKPPPCSVLAADGGRAGAKAQRADLEGWKPLRTCYLKSRELDQPHPKVKGSPATLRPSVV